MAPLTSVDPDDLRDALARVEDAKPAKRLMIALAYLDGVPVSALSERYDLPRSTVYYWLDRLESEPLSEAIHDDPRPGRPPELAASDRDALRQALSDPPSAQGYDAPEWTPSLVRRHISETCGVDYSTGHARRLLDRFRDA